MAYIILQVRTIEDFAGMLIRHSQNFGESAMLVWVGHSCPTPLTLGLLLTWLLQSHPIVWSRFFPLACQYPKLHHFLLTQCRHARYKSRQHVPIAPRHLIY